MTRAKQRLRGKVALITGATRGIGLAIARALAAEGCHLVITGRDTAALKKVSRELKSRGNRVLTCVCDVRDIVSVQELSIAVEGRFHSANILINNAGIAHENKKVDQLSFERWREVIDTNLNGMFLVTHCVLPLMKRGGTIVNNLSIAAKRVFPGSSAYNASKHGALGFTTIELKSNFLGTTRQGAIVCDASVAHAGRTTQVWDAVVRAGERTIALFRCTQLVLYPT